MTPIVHSNSLIKTISITILIAAVYTLAPMRVTAQTVQFLIDLARKGGSQQLGQLNANFAASFVVTNLNDSGPGSLRQAITDANASPGHDQITFASGLAGTILLTSARLDISDNVTVDGPGANVITVSGGGTINSSGQFSSTLAGLRVPGMGTTGRSWTADRCWTQARAI